MADGIGKYYISNKSPATRPCYWLGAVALLLSIVASSGCSKFRRGSDSSYVTIGKAPVARAEQAKKLNSDALKAAKKGDWQKSEQLFQQALESDVNYAPAHNNLGQIYLRRHQLYLAAWEFEFAANLMPDRVEPNINLGLVYETAGQLEKAAETYGKALEIAPDDRNALACSARVAVKQDEAPDRIHWLLEQVVMHDDRAEWLNWAKELLATRYRLDAPQELSRDRPLTQPFPGYQYQSLDIGSPEQLPIDQAPIIEQPDQTPSSSRQLKEPSIEPLPVPSPKAPGGPLQEASSFNLSRAGLPTVPSEITFPSKIPYVQTPISANNGMVVPASGEVRLP